MSVSDALCSHQTPDWEIWINDFTFSVNGNYRSMRWYVLSKYFIPGTRFCPTHFNEILIALFLMNQNSIFISSKQTCLSQTEIQNSICDYVAVKLYRGSFEITDMYALYSHSDQIRIWIVQSEQDAGNGYWLMTQFFFRNRSPFYLKSDSGKMSSLEMLGKRGCNLCLWI